MDQWFRSSVRPFVWGLILATFLLDVASGSEVSDASRGQTVETGERPAPSEGLPTAAMATEESVGSAGVGLDLAAKLSELGSKIGSVGDESGRLNLLLAEAGKDIDEAKANRVLLDAERGRVASYDTRIAELANGLAELNSKPNDVTANLSPEEIERESNRVRGDLDISRKQVEVLRGRASTFEMESDAAARRLVELQTQFTSITELLRGAGGSGTIEGELQRFANQAEKARLESVIDLLRYRLEHRDQLETLIENELEVEALRINQLSAWEKQLRDRIEQIRNTETRETREKLEQVAGKIAGDNTELLAYAERTAEIARELEEVTRQASEDVRLLSDLNLKVRELSSDYEALRSQVENFGGSVAVGRLLLLRRGEVLAGSRDVGNVAETRSRLTHVTERRIDLTVGAEGRTLRQPSGEDGAEETGLLKARIDVLDQLVRAYRDQAVGLTNLLAAQLQFLEVQNRFTSSLDKWLIGTRTSRRLGIGDLPEVVGEMMAASAVTLRERSIDVFSLLKNEAMDLGLVLGLVLLLFGLRTPVNRSGERMREKMRRIRTDRMWFPIGEILCGLVRILPLPLLLFGLGWLIDGSFGLASVSGYGFSFRFAGVFLGALLAISDFGRDQGLGPTYLKWNLEWCRHYRREFRYFVPIIALLSFFTNGSVTVANERGLEEIRGYLFAVLLVYGVFVFRLLRSGSVWMQGEVGKESWIAKRRKWIRLILMVPVLLGSYGLVAGYGYTVGITLREFGKSIGIVVALVILRGVVERALSLSNRKLRLQQSLKRLEENRERNNRTEGADVPSALSVEEPPLDLTDLGEKASRLVGALFFSTLIVLLWSVWTQSIPLFETLDGVELPFSKTVEVAGVAQSVPMTISDLVQALIILLLTIVATANLPGLLEILVLPLFNLDRGARYAVSSLTQYGILAIGTYLFFTSLGFEWSSIQWLVAALGVGLGFGLQEIVANFVSGIIILFERPVRVGDLVTVGDTSGIVSKIRIRATTILNWDKQELLVPNKEFITGRLLNWTLSDPLNRIVIPVGVAYGTDTRRALEILGKVARDHPDVLDDPAPLLTFEGFGDSALNLILRCYLRNYDNRIGTISELHHRVRETFEREGIEIAFPQMDLHIRSGLGSDKR